jgi:hypothetical protein
MKIPKTDYPKDISGVFLMSGDSSINLEEIEVTFFCTITGKGARKVQSIGVRFPSRHTDKGKRTILSNDNITIDYGIEDNLYSLRLTSISSLIDLESSVPMSDSELDKYIEETSDVELAIFTQIGLQCWGVLEDSFTIFDLCGNLIKKTIQAAEETGSDPPELDI